MSKTSDKQQYRRICIQRSGYAIVPANSDEEAIAYAAENLTKSDFDWEPVNKDMIEAGAIVVEVCIPNGEDVEQKEENVDKASESFHITIFQAPFASLIESGAWKRIHSMSFSTDPENVPAEYYLPVFNGEIEASPQPDEFRTLSILERVFQIFNLEHPAGYCGRSLSVGDVIKLEGKYYLCRPIGFLECRFASSSDNSASLTPPSSSPESSKNAE